MKNCESDGVEYLTNPPKNKCKNCGQFWFVGSTTPACIQQNWGVPTSKPPKVMPTLRQRFESQFPIEETYTGKNSIFTFVNVPAPERFLAFVESELSAERERIEERAKNLTTFYINGVSQEVKFVRLDAVLHLLQEPLTEDK